MTAAATSPEAAVTTRLLAHLGADRALLRAVHGLYAAPVLRMTPPFIEIAAITGSDWGTKDRAGAELLLTLRHAAPVGDDGCAVAARLRALVPGLRGQEAGWTIVAARLLRTRRAFDRQGRVEQQFDVRLRLLAGG
jgi:hypothetical protein